MHVKQAMEQPKFYSIVCPEGVCNVPEDNLSRVSLGGFKECQLGNVIRTSVPFALHHGPRVGAKKQLIA